MFEVLQRTYEYLNTIWFRAFRGMWREEAGIDTELEPGWVGHPEQSKYYGIFSIAKSMD
jgi:hypothetical protein